MEETEVDTMFFELGWTMMMLRTGLSPVCIIVPFLRVM